MCSIKPMFSYQVLPERLDKVERLRQIVAARMTKEQVLDVFFELGWAELISFDEQGSLALELTPVQTVAAVAALICVVEAGATRVKTGAGV